MTLGANLLDAMSPCDQNARDAAISHVSKLAAALDERRHISHISMPDAASLLVNAGQLCLSEMKTLRYSISRLFTR